MDEILHFKLLSMGVEKLKVCLHVVQFIPLGCLSGSVATVENGNIAEVDMLEPPSIKSLPGVIAIVNGPLVSTVFFIDLR